MLLLLKSLLTPSFTSTQRYLHAALRLASFPPLAGAARGRSAQPPGQGNKWKRPGIRGRCCSVLGWFFPFQKCQWEVDINWRQSRGQFPRVGGPGGGGALVLPCRRRWKAEALVLHFIPARSHLHVAAAEVF